MKILMISLDKKVLEPGSRTARRIIEYGQRDRIYVLVPNARSMSLKLNENVIVEAISGNKISQFWKFFFRGLRVLKKQDIDEITAQDPFFIGLIGLLLKMFSGRRIEIQVHGDFFSSGYYSGWRLMLARWVTRRADKVRVAGERIKQSVIKLGVAENKITVKPVMIDVEKIKNFQPTINLHEKYFNHKKIFLFLGRLEPVKNLPWLIEIFSQVAQKNPDYLLLIVGSGSEIEKLSVQVRKLHLERNVKFEDWTHDPRSYLKTSDGLLLSSLSEGYGLAAMEATAVGTPVIMTDVGVANFELKPGPKVTIVSVGDKAAFILAILKI